MTKKDDLAGLRQFVMSLKSGATIHRHGMNVTVREIRKLDEEIAKLEVIFAQMGRGENA